MYDDSPDWRRITGLCECLYHSHPIRSDIAGTVKSIAEITPEMLYDCCKAFYAPNNMVLAAAGNASMEQILAACARPGLMEARPVERVQRLWTEEPMTLAAAEKTITMPVSKPCFGFGFKEQPLQHDDLRSEILYDLILCCISGGMSRLYRKLYDEGLTNPGVGGEVLRVDGCCCILFTGESDVPDTVRQLLLDEIVRSGTTLDAAVSSELLKNIFFVKAPMHDGAVIIRQGRILGAGCMLPLSKNVNLSRDLGMRHRAGIGMSENSDAVVGIVAEETGSISVAIGGMLKRHLMPETLRQLLRTELMPQPEEEPDKPRLSLRELLHAL